MKGLNITVRMMRVNEEGTVEIHGPSRNPISILMDSRHSLGWAKQKRLKILVYSGKNVSVFKLSHA